MENLPSEGLENGHGMGAPMTSPFRLQEEEGDWDHKQAPGQFLEIANKSFLLFSFF